MKSALHIILGHHPMAVAAPTMADGGAAAEVDPHAVDLYKRMLERKKSQGMALGGEAEPDSDEGLHAIAEELIQAVENKDAAHVASCLQDAFELLEMQPHEEAEHSV